MISNVLLSHVCSVAGYSLICFSLFYYIIDVKAWNRWAFFFKVIGTTSITIYMLTCIIDFSRANRFFCGSIIKLFDSDWNKLVAQTFYLLCWLILYFFYRKKIFQKV